MITIYGSPRTSAGRCIWALEEIGVDYKVQAVDMRQQEHKSAAFLKMNPNGKVPVLQDNDFTLFESMAINSYLAEKHKPELLGKGPGDRAKINQWNLWMSTEVQPLIITIFIQKIFLKPEQREQKLIDDSEKKIQVPLKILDTHLTTNPFLLGQDFSIADLNLHSVISIASAISLSLEAFPNMQQWMKKIEARPAYIKYQALRKS